jgi:hypothetical protein
MRICEVILSGSAAMSIKIPYSIQKLDISHSSHCVLIAFDSLVKFY